ncbi:MAG: transketolase [Spirochaetaceae bacterium]|nr:MAG: transketolase [Spirochaetaceae bacterium]
MSSSTGTASWTDEAARVAHGIRCRALELTLEKNGCYLSQALSSADILAVLYTRVLNIGPSRAPLTPPPFGGVPRPGLHHLGADYNGPRAPHYDRLLLSAAHYAVAVYAALVETGRMAPEALSEFNADGSSVEMIGAEHSPGMELTTGSFGQALSQAGGVALARRLKGESGKVWVFMSDGECEEGQTWEAVQALAHHGLDNVGVYIDVNGQQVDGLTRDVMNIEPLADRFAAFGAAVVTADGHDIEALESAARSGHTGRPLVILCYTNSAQGVELLEERKPNLHFVRFRNQDEINRYRGYLREMQRWRY